MALSGQFDVSATGAATYNIPIALPPGTAGMAPTLSLEYNSQVGNGLLGIGWTLAGLPSIGRCPRNIAQDGVVAGVNYDTNDRFCMDGQRLVNISGTYGADGTEYRTEVDTFSRIISHGAAGSGPAWFELRTKSGQVMEFGHTADSQILPLGNTSARNWALNKVSDTKTNYFTVSYNNDAQDGLFFPIEIDYAANTAAGVSPANKVQFVYANRPDYVPQYQGGALLQIPVRLTDIKAYAGTTLVSDYRLTYSQSGPSSRSRVTSITVCEGGGTCLPSTNVNWTNTVTGLDSPQGWIAQYGSTLGFPDDNTTPRMLVDVNGDGLPDIVAFASNGVVVSLNTGTGFGGPQLWIGQYGSSLGFPNDNSYPRMLVDVNGDGLPDVVAFASNGVAVSLNTGTSFGGPALWVGQYGTGQGWTDMNTLPRMLVDVNGDGLPDVVGFASNSVVVSLNTGTGFSPPQTWSTQYGSTLGFPDNNTYPRMLVDVNGDGLPDVVAFASNGVVVSLNTGTSFGGPALWIGQYGTGQGWTDMNTLPRMLVDVNGDGLPDVVGFASNSVVVSLNTGTSFTAPQTWIPQYGSAMGFPNNTTYPRMVVDVNGDGLPDVVAFASNSVVLSLNTGTAFAAPQTWIAQYGSTQGFPDGTTPRMVLDLNGDGLPDVLGFAVNSVVVSPNSANGLPDLVSSVVNGLGATTTISYTPATNRSVVTKGTGTAFPSLDLTGPMYVVSRVDVTNGLGGIYSSSYSYSGGRIDAHGRGFLGFAQKSVKDLQTSLVETATFRQDFPYIGMMASATKVLGTQTLNQASSTLQFLNASGAATLSTPSIASAPYRVSISQSINSSFDLDGSAIPPSTTNYQYDAYGNATQVVVSTPDGFSKTTVNTYTNDTTKWFLGRLTAATVTSVAP